MSGRWRQGAPAAAKSREADLKKFANLSKLGSNPYMQAIHKFGPFRLDTRAEMLFRGSEPIALGRRAVTLLRVLVERAGTVVAKDALIEAAWSGLAVEEGNLTVQIASLRRAFAGEPGGDRWIETLPTRGYRFVGPAVTTEEIGPVAATSTGAPALSLPDRPSVAVLPFANLSGDPQQDYFSDGITEDITTELSRFSELLVIARNSSFQYKGKAVDIRQVGRELGARYVLEGSVRRSGDRLRITAQLIDAVTGAHRWGERYDREPHDTFAVQDEVARTIVAILAAHVNRAEIERALLKPPAAWEAYDYYLRGAEAFFLHLNRRTKASLHVARRLLEQSLAIDPGYARAAAMLSWTQMFAYTEPFDGDYLSPAALDRALELAETAVGVDARLPQARAQLGHVLLYRRQHDAAIAEFERAFTLNPNFIDSRYAAALMHAGEPARAIEVLEANRRLDPFSPLLYSTGWLGMANYSLKRYGEAVRLLRECVSRLPNLQWPHLFLAGAYAQSGQLEEARAEAAEVLRINPGFAIEKHQRIFVYKNPKDAEHRLDGLRKAGLPES
jgi:adenylate cyclase